jgi:hypothetical protein
MKDIIDGTRCFCFLIPENYTSRWPLFPVMY